MLFCFREIAGTHGDQAQVIVACRLIWLELERFFERLDGVFMATGAQIHLTENGKDSRFRFDGQRALEIVLGVVKIPGIEGGDSQGGQRA